jgi:hypothetical protein
VSLTKRQMEGTKSPSGDAGVSGADVGAETIA